jgi:uncharacterized cupredoxin-like copper-binding protein
MNKKLTKLAVALVISGASLTTVAESAKEYQEMVKNADWDAMKTVTVNIDEFSYDANLTLQAGQTYKLEMKNIGEKKHYFTAPEFFKNIATRKAQVNGQAEIKADYFTAFEILPGGQLDLYFVAHNKGEFPVYCTVDNHREEGMDDLIVVN